MENNTPGVKYWFWKVYINNFLRSPTGFRVTSQIFFLRNHLSVSLGFLHTGKMVNSLWSHCKIKQPKVFNQQGYKSLQNICGCFILISHFKDYNHLKSLAAWLSNRNQRLGVSFPWRGYVLFHVREDQHSYRKGHGPIYCYITVKWIV